MAHTLCEDNSIKGIFSKVLVKKKKKGKENKVLVATRG